MTAGRLDRRILLERATFADDGFTSAGTETWTPIATVWAEVTPISDGERWRAGQVAAESTHRFLVRYSSVTGSLTPADRVGFDGMLFNITGKPKEIGRREFVEITAAAMVDE